MSRSLGHGDSYPFVLPDPVLNKLVFVDAVVRSASGLDWQIWPPAAPGQNGDADPAPTWPNPDIITPKA
jgi:hypothetical protein